MSVYLLVAIAVFAAFALVAGGVFILLGLSAAASRGDRVRGLDQVDDGTSSPDEWERDRWAS